MLEVDVDVLVLVDVLTLVLVDVETDVLVLVFVEVVSAPPVPVSSPQPMKVAEPPMDIIRKEQRRIGRFMRGVLAAPGPRVTTADRDVAGPARSRRK